jgi:hypothetical protein
MNRLYLAGSAVAAALALAAWSHLHPASFRRFVLIVVLSLTLLPIAAFVGWLVKR